MTQPAVDFEVEEVIAIDHPCLAGHFPGNPIVPGVVLLDRIITAVEKCSIDSYVVAIPRTKFLAPLRPGVPFRIALKLKSDQQAHFRCLVQDEPIAEGILKMHTDRAH